MVAPADTADVLDALGDIEDATVRTGGDSTLQLELQVAGGGAFDPATYAGDAAKATAVRTAFLLTVPRDTIVDDLVAPLWPKAEVATGVLPRVSPDAGGAAAPDGAADTDAAASALEAADITDPVVVRVLTNTADPLREAMLDRITDSAAEAGFQVEPYTPVDAWATDVRNEPEAWDVALVPVPQADLPVDAVVTRWQTNGLANLTSWTDPSTDVATKALAGDARPGRRAGRAEAGRDEPGDRRCGRLDRAAAGRRRPATAAGRHDTARDRAPRARSGRPDLLVGVGAQVAPREVGLVTIPAAPSCGRVGLTGAADDPARSPPSEMSSPMSEPTSAPTGTSVRADLRNVAIVAHVDHGKTTLVDAMLWQSGSFGSHAHVDERAMDSGDLEREKGITILAKNTAIRYTGPAAAEIGQPDGITINVIDTPGHADFGGEVERGLSMVDGVVLLVDASEGPLPQTRFVLRKALVAKLPVILVVNKTDRPDARISDVVHEATDLLLGLASDLHEDVPDLDLDAILDVPVVFAAAKAGRASLNQPADGGLPDAENLEPLFKTILERIPAPTYTEGAPLQAHVTNLDASPFLGRLALLRVFNGTIRKGQTVAWAKADGTLTNVKITELLETKALERVSTDSAGPGDIVAVAGIENITIGETLTDPDDPRPLPMITVDDPAISMTIGINTSPLAGRGGKGHKVTARQVKDRLDKELVGNVSLRVLPDRASRRLGGPGPW